MLYEPEENHILGEQALLAPEVSFLVAEQGDHIVGCGAVRCMPGGAETTGQPYGEVKRMMVLPAWRGQRVGALLLESLESELRRAGMRWALLETGVSQVEAVRLYERRGYRRRAAFGGYPDNGLSVFLEKPLAS
jgi:putative acetyltransferase